MKAAGEVHELEFIGQVLRNIVFSCWISLKLVRWETVKSIEGL